MRRLFIQATSYTHHFVCLKFANGMIFMYVGVCNSKHNARSYWSTLLSAENR